VKQFIPTKVFYEAEVLDYEMGIGLLDKYSAKGIQTIEIKNHNKIPILRDLPDSEFLKMKRYLILGVRKTLRLIPNNRSADYIVPFTSSGCTAMCLYCYLLCTFFKGSYLRIFVNREAMINMIRKKANQLNDNTIFELGSNSDMVLENTITGNLNWAIEEFAGIKKATATLATKFSMVDDLLNLDHNGHTQIRISVNPNYLIKKVEIGTSSLMERIEAANKLFTAGYRVGLNIAPIILIEEWQTMYTELFKTLKQELKSELKKQLFLEIIFMTYGYANQTINSAALPGTLEIFDRELMKPKGRGKYCYKPDVIREAKDFVIGLINRYLPYASISYIV
jgi:spore photoproduct lyase